MFIIGHCKHVLVYNIYKCFTASSSLWHCSSLYCIGLYMYEVHNEVTWLGVPVNIDA